MKIALLGYGKMGKAIEAIAVERGHEICLKVDKENANSFNNEALALCEVAIEFSQPESAVDNINRCIEAGVPVVVGTTGWYHHYESVCETVKRSKTALLAATNFSIGVNIFFALNRKLAQLMAGQKEYQAGMEEIHHLQKLDSPSGTAITLAEDLIDQHPQYADWINKPSEDSRLLSIISERKAGVPGTHSVRYESDIDYLEITHTAKSRKGFAMGALLAAEFIYQKEGVFQMKDLLNI